MLVSERTLQLQHNQGFKSTHTKWITIKTAVPHCTLNVSGTCLMMHQVAVDGDTLKIGVEGQEITPTDEEVRLDGHTHLTSQIDTFRFAS